MCKRKASHKAPANVKKLKDDVKGSEAVLLAVPEYNFSIPGTMKNAINWLYKRIL
ncbi:NADPH-dependent FMN reductase [Bacillus aerolatus]|uniref:NADPH-dependent FMN reductase n=1 Tax=Bacillus aerolatus TaxID=2653354 RepID=UPI0038500A86